MNIDLRKPSISVLLRKNVSRTTLNGSAPLSSRYAGQQRDIDLTPYLGDSNSVRVMKSVREPAGAFSIALSDQVDPNLLDSFYSDIEPMDSIEISVSGPGYVSGGGQIPIMMRGFVSQVERREGMSAEGKPTRMVVISGQDYGKILQIMQVFFMPNTQDSGNMITSFPFFAKFGDFGNVMDAGAFTQAIFDRVINPYLDTMRGITDDAAAKAAAAARQKQYAALVDQMGQVLAKETDLYQQAMRAKAAGDQTSFNAYIQQWQASDKQYQALNKNADALKAQGFTVDGASPVFNINTDIQVTGAQVSPFGTGGWQGGTIANLMQTYADIGPWNEFFIEDRFDGPYAVYRPNPFMDAVTLQYIQPLPPGKTPPAITDIDRTDVISMTSARSDANIGNYFWVESARFNLNYDMTTKAYAYQSAQVQQAAPFFVQNYGNVNPTLYGTRKIQEATNQAGSAELNNGNGTQAGPPRSASQASALGWMNTRRQQLFDQNKDNVIFETGSMRLKGNEKIKAGTYVRLTHGNMRSLYYVVSVVHDFTPFGNYFTEVQFERGTGFIDRVQRAGGQDSPYWDELVTKNQ